MAMMLLLAVVAAMTAVKGMIAFEMVTAVTVVMMAVAPWRRWHDDGGAAVMR